MELINEELNYIYYTYIMCVVSSFVLKHTFFIDNLVSYIALSNESAIRDVQYKQKVFFNQLRTITKDPLLDGVGSTRITYIFLYIHLYYHLVIGGGFQCQNAEHYQQSSASSGVAVPSRCPAGRWPEESVVLLECHGLQLYHLHDNRWAEELYTIYLVLCLTFIIDHWTCP